MNGDISWQRQSRQQVDAQLICDDWNRFEVSGVNEKKRVDETPITYSYFSFVVRI